jgi:fatty acid desaturase
MVPWWGVLVACVFFGFWTVLCFMVGAAVKDTVIKKEQQQKVPNAKLN